MDGSKGYSRYKGKLMLLDIEAADPAPADAISLMRSCYE
jgi:hypothetical protein